MRKKIELGIARNWGKIVTLITLIFLFATECLLIDPFGWGFGQKSASSYWDNVIIEFVVGALFSVFPIALGVYFGQTLKRTVFEDDIKSILIKFREMRLRGKITPPETRDLVKGISVALGDDILKEEWFEKEYSSSISDHKTKKCGVCGIDAVVNRKSNCIKCKLNCHSWQFDK